MTAPRALCPDCQHETHAAGDGECETPVHHGPTRIHRCLCLARPGANTACPPQMDCQGGTLGYADIWYLQRGSSVRGADGQVIPPSILHAAPVPARRRLTEAEHDRAWHAIDGLEWEAFPDADTVLNAVLTALGIDPPSAQADPCSGCRYVPCGTCPTTAEGAGA